MRKCLLVLAFALSALALALAVFDRTPVAAPEPHSSRAPAFEKQEPRPAACKKPCPVTRPVAVVARYGFTEEGYRPYAVVDFGRFVPAAVSGKVSSCSGDSVVIAGEHNIVITYRGMELVWVVPGQEVAVGDALGQAANPVRLEARCGSFVVDPVALLWPDMSPFRDEAVRVEQERRAIAERRHARHARAASAVRCPQEYEALFREAAERTGLDPALLKAVAAAESGFDPKAVSEKGAMGIMQILPGTAKELGVSDPFDPAQNIMAGAVYLKRQLVRFGDLELALAAYNAGPTEVMTRGGVPPYEETHEFIENVLSHYRKN